MLGNRRFLIIVISVLSAVALICLGASAVDRDIDVFDENFDFEIVSSPDLEVVRDNNSSSFSLLDSQYYSFSIPFSGLGEGRGTGATVYSFAIYDDSGVYLFGHDFALESGGTGIVWRSGNTLVYSYNNGVRDITISYDFHSSSPHTITFLRPSGTYLGFSGTLVSNTPVSSLSNKLFEIGNSLISFVLSSWVVLVPIVAFVCILGFGVIRRLIKGV